MIALNPQVNLTTSLSPDELLAALNQRYAVKQFDPARAIDTDTWNALEAALVLTPSSGGLQPWKFFVVDDPALRTQLREASYGQTQITDADRLVVLTARTDFTAADVERFIKRVAEVRNVPVESLAGLGKMLSTNLAKSAEARAEWTARQAYIAVGNLLAAAAVLGVDATPMEGFDPARYDAILGLPAKGYRAVVAVPLGYRAASDRYATLPKVRFEHTEVIEHV
jgi:nitroreductase